jgi:hypothetical protein
MTRMRNEIRELRREIDFFKLAAAYFAKEQLSPTSMNSQSANFSFHWIANKLDFSRSGYYAWLHRQDNPGPRTQEEETIATAIVPILSEHRALWIISDSPGATGTGFWR